MNDGEDSPVWQIAQLIQISFNLIFDGKISR